MNNRSQITSKQITKTQDEKSSKSITIPMPKFAFPRSTNGFPVIVLVIFAFFLGMLVNKVQYLEKNNTSGSSALVANNPASDTAQDPQAVPTEDLRPKKVSIDDDPVLGDENAKVTIIDFSDYECPFCKRYFDETFAQIKKDYIDTGKVKYVYRDLPLSFHDPMATLEAVAANCARLQGDDVTYFSYHDEIFKRTKSNGNGLSKEDLSTIATDLALNVDAFNTCIADEKNKDEVKKDIVDAGKVGASGTPSFFIGKSTSDGTITGTPLIGAQPYSEFKKIIDQELNN